MQCWYFSTTLSPQADQDMGINSMFMNARRKRRMLQQSDNSDMPYPGHIHRSRGCRVDLVNTMRNTKTWAWDAHIYGHVTCARYVTCCHSSSSAPDALHQAPTACTTPSEGPTATSCCWLRAYSQHSPHQLTQLSLSGEEEAACLTWGQEKFLEGGLFQEFKKK